jgi:TrwC relaxase
LQATAAACIEASLSHEFGVAWMARADGVGYEIAGITEAEIDAFSSRRASITGADAPIRHSTARARFVRLEHARAEFAHATRRVNPRRVTPGR